MQRIILHIDMDAFFPAIEERENPQFGRMPIIVGADPKGGKGRGVVSSASYSARKFGVKSGMPISKAYQLCPKAIFLPVNMELYEKVSENIMNIVKKYLPRSIPSESEELLRGSSKWETVSLDEAYLDLSFLGSYHKAENLAQKLKKEILEKEKLISTVGIGPNKLIAKMATNQGKPNGLVVVKPGQVKSFLEPLDIEELPGVGPKTAEKLRTLKINTINELKRLSKTELKNMFGIVGEAIYEKARGIDEEEVTSEEIIKSVGKEYTFERDTRDPEIIFKAFEKIIKDVYHELTSNRFSFKTITVICRFQGFETHTKSKTLKKPTSDFEVLKKESKKLLLRFLIENPKLIRLIGLRVKIC